jgi:hypothetical protein
METVGNQGIDHQYIVVDPIEKIRRFNAFSEFKRRRTRNHFFARQKPL